MLKTIGFAGVALLLMVSLGYGRASIVDEGGRWGEYSSGIESESDMEIWTPWEVLCDAAKHGNAKAQFSIGLRYETGYGVAVDLRKATQCYRLAAEQGLAEAQYNLGVACGDGTGVSQDAQEAVRWYRMAAAQGHAAALLMLRKNNLDQRKGSNSFWKYFIGFLLVYGIRALFKGRGARRKQYGPNPSSQGGAFSKEGMLPCGQLASSMVAIPGREFHVV